MIVVDASIAARWFVAEEAGRKSALTLLDEIKNSPAEFAVPDLFYIEMMNLLSRITANAHDLEKYVQGLFDLGFVQVRVGAKLLKRAAQLAFKHKLSGYDALYVAVAESIGGHWVTGDIKAHNKIKALGLSKVI